MEILKNKFIARKKGGRKIELAIGSLYLLLPDYCAINQYDFEHMEILVAMPVSINGDEIWLCCLAMSDENSLHVSEHDNGNLIMMQEDISNVEYHTLCPHELQHIVQRMPMRGQYSVAIGKWQAEVYLMNMQCSGPDITHMPIIPIGIKLTDLRQWPKIAINMWARRHLGLSQEQLTAIDGFGERWKMIAYAQEVFTYHCADFNPDARKKMAKINKVIMEEKVRMFRANSEDLAHCPTQDLCAKDNYMVEVGQAGLFRSIAPPYSENQVKVHYRDVATNHVYHIKLMRILHKTTDDGDTPGYHIKCYVDGDRYAVTMGNRELKAGDMCIVHIDDNYLHISRNSPENKNNRIYQDWHRSYNGRDQDQNAPVCFTTTKSTTRDVDDHKNRGVKGNTHPSDYMRPPRKYVANYGGVASYEPKSKADDVDVEEVPEKLCKANERRNTELETPLQKHVKLANQGKSYQWAEEDRRGGKIRY